MSACFVCISACFVPFSARNCWETHWNPVPARCAKFSPQSAQADFVVQAGIRSIYLRILMRESIVSLLHGISWNGGTGRFMQQSAPMRLWVSAFTLAPHWLTGQIFPIPHQRWPPCCLPGLPCRKPRVCWHSFAHVAKIITAFWCSSSKLAPKVCKERPLDLNLDVVLQFMEAVDTFKRGEASESQLLTTPDDKLRKNAYPLVKLLVALKHGQVVMST